MITEADIAGIQCPYEGRAVALSLWNERVREAAQQAPQEEWDAKEVSCAACGRQPSACCCASNG